MGHWAVLILTHVGCFVGGLVAMRWLVARGLRRAEEVADHVLHHDHPHPSREPAMPTRRAPLVIGVVILSLILFGIGVRVGYGLVEGRQDCLDEYATRNAEAQEARQGPVEDRDKQTTLVFNRMDKFLSQPQSQDEFRRLREAVRDYNREAARLEREREENPIPDPPREVC